MAAAGLAAALGAVALGAVALGAVALGAVALGAAPASAQLATFDPAVGLGDRRVTLRWDRVPGDTLSVTERRADARLLFGGYQIWRSTFADPDHFELLRTYSLFDSTWTFRADERVFVDSDSINVRGCTGVPPPGGGFTCDPLTGRAIAPFNGFFYYYALTWFQARFDTIGGQARVATVPMQTPVQGRLASAVQPAAPSPAIPPLLGKVHVVPNPYNPADAANRLRFGNESRLTFVGLPSPSTVRIFTAAGDLVKVLENDDGNDTANWDLKNGGGDDVVGGLYLYQVESTRARLETTGHFVVIR